MRTRTLFAFTFAALVATSIANLADPDAPAATGCTPKREAAVADITQKEVTCMTSKANDPNKTPTQALAECGISNAVSEVQDLIDLFTGAQLRYICATAGGPHCTGDAPAGAMLPKGDAGK